jgi:Holliday junction resolvase-like predicted endonuclease
MPKSMPARAPSSSEAEGLLARELAGQGWSILARNYRRHGFELDIVASKGTTLLILEVKARRWVPRDARDLEMLLPLAKRAALRRGGTDYYGRFGARLDGIKTLRFDLAVVCPGRTGRPAIKYFVDVLGR